MVRDHAALTCSVQQTMLFPTEILKTYNIRTLVHDIKHKQYVLSTSQVAETLKKNREVVLLHRQYSFRLKSPDLMLTHCTSILLVAMCAQSYTHCHK